MSLVPVKEICVLIIDDEESIRDACAHVLTGEGFKVCTAPDGEKALALVDEKAPDIVFVDLKMPKMAGMAVLDELNVRAPDSVKVVITAYATVSSALEAVRHGAYDFLPKPFTPEELRGIASRALERCSLVKKTRELQAERDQAKHRFLQLVTSEVRSPVAAALTKLHQLDHDLADHPKQQELAHEAADRLERLLKLVDRWQQSV